MAKEKESAWEKIKRNLSKSLAGKPDDDDDPDSTTSDDPTNDDDDNDDEYEDAAPVIKALTDKIVNLEETIEVMAKAQTALLDKFEETASMQKSLGQGILALMDRTEEVIASPAPRKGAVTGLEAALAKSQAGGNGAGGVSGGLKPFTAKTFDITKDILNKAVSDGEIDIPTCARYETHINKSIGKAVYAFPEDFVAFMKKHVG